MVGLGCRLPILPVERADLDGGEIDAVNATHIKSPPAWVQSGANERVDSAVLAEIVLRRLRIELIKGQIVFARQDAKVCVCRRMPERALSATHGAVAINNVIELGPSLECDPATVARAL